MMVKFVDSPYVEEVKKVTFRLFIHGWDERNGGNVSYRLLPEEIEQFEDVKTVKRSYPIDFDVTGLEGRYFLVTATGRYFKNIIDFPERDLGLIQISDDGKQMDLLWGYSDGAKPTSEFPTHLMGHQTRLKVNKDQRVIMHCHPTNLIAMTFTQKMDEREMTRILWKMQSESLVVFPEGVGIIPWMVPGTSDIGKATAKKLEDFGSVIWPHHGLFGSGSSIDEVFGLIETIEKAAQIWTVIQMQGGGFEQTITDQNLKDLAEVFGVTPREGYLN